jgi:hypothetical protein
MLLSRINAELRVALANWSAPAAVEAWRLAPVWVSGWVCGISCVEAMNNAEKLKEGERRILTLERD